MKLTTSGVLTVLKRTGAAVADDDVPSLAAAIAYYTVFSLPPLLVVLIGLAGAAVGAERVTEAIIGQVGGLIGPEGGAEIRTMIENASTLGTGIGAKVAGLAALLFGATGAFGQLQKALNRAWGVDKSTAGGGLLDVIVKRALSFGMVLTIAFLLLVSLAISAALAALSDASGALVPTGFAGVFARITTDLVSVGVVSVLFALMFRYLPDAEVRWKDVWVGAVVTSLFFSVGKVFIGLYLGIADPGGAFGAAGALALILVWIYYSSLIVLVGAEFTQVWAEAFGGGIEPDSPGGDDGSEPAGRPPTPSGDGATYLSDSLPEVAHPVAAPRDPSPY
ncbi:MAG: YihY/virulence factor BrkB family protein [Bacteroidota bacterium]